MASRLVRAAAAMVLVVCLSLAGEGSMTAAAVKRSHVGRGSIAAGRAHTVMALPDGHVTAWGAGTRGQLGDGALVNRSTPVAVAGLDNVVAVAAGAAQTFAVTSTGEVWAWGANTFGRLGDGTRKRRPRPVRVPGVSSVTMIAAGRAHTLALTAGGSVYAWGRNTNGQLGTGHKVASLVPVMVPGLSDIVAIAAGDNHSLAVSRDGRLFAWGDNHFSTLGDGTTRDRDHAVQIAVTDVVAVAGGAAHSLALRRDGSVYSWGRGANGALGTGSTRTATTPKRLSGLTARAIAAGRQFSGAIRDDGKVAMWGANESGQLGDGTTTSRDRPTLIDGLSSVEALALGDAHTVAVTTTGDLRTWGEGDLGRLGTGSLIDQPAPFEILSDVPDWGAEPGEDTDPVPPSPPLSAPALSIGAGTYSAEQAVVVSSADAGVTLRYTQNGGEPDESAAAIASGGTVNITQSQVLKVRAFKAGEVPSAVTSAVYTLQVATPTIAPSAGTFETPQYIAMSTPTAAAAIHYTTDGSDPGIASPVYIEAFVLDATTTLKARAFRSNWNDSAVNSTTLTITPGPLSTPVALPAGGWIRVSQRVTLIADAGTEIRYTLDGTAPSPASLLYLSPLTIPADSTVVRARAFRANWTASAASSDLYRFDSTVPSITASQFPVPLNGWHVTPVTITFQCSDDVAVASCPGSATIAGEGAAQTMSATAVDSAGNENSVQQTLNLDFTPPVVTLLSPQGRPVTTDASIVIAATVSDALSGLALVKCNGAPATVAEGVVACIVPLRPGRNDIVVSAIDVAGNSASAGLTVFRAATSVTTLDLSPSRRTMLIGETSTLSLRDDFGMPVLGASWTSSDPEVVTVSNDDPLVVTAVASGSAVVFAEQGDNFAATTILVDDIEVLSDGSEKWIAVRPYAPQLADAAPIYTHRIDADGADAFRVAVDTTTSESTVWPIKTDTGETDGGMIAPGIPLMGDAYGGLIAAIEEPKNHCNSAVDLVETCYTALVRFAGPASTVSWRYESRGYLNRPAQGPDGTIYVVEHTRNAQIDAHKSVVMIDGLTGRATARVPLENSTDSVVSDTCKPGTSPFRPVTFGPIVSGDGFGYLLVSRIDENLYDTCGGGVRQRTGVESVYTFGLLRLSKAGQVGDQQIVDTAHHETTWPPPSPRQLLPDGVGGLLVVADYRTTQNGSIEKRVTHFDAGGQRTDRVVPYGTTIELVGQAGTLYLDEVVQGTSIISVAKTAVDVNTWQTRWTLPPNYSWVAASPSGGAIVSLPYAPPFTQPSEQLTEFDSMGQVVGIRGVYLKAPVQNNGTWIGSSSDWMVAKAGAFDDATRWDARPTIANQLTPTRFGSAQSDSRMQSPGMGVFAKTHHAAHDYSVLGIPAAWAVRFRHVSLRIVPHDQAYWFDRMGAAFSGLDTFGNWFFTLGAGMGDSDTSTACSGGLLKKGISRPNDLTVPPVDPLERLAFRESEETQVIDGLLNHYNAYGDDLPYNCFPEGDATFLIPPHPGTWNSNSFAAGLIEAAGLPLPRLPRAFFRLFPGFATAVPLPNFQ